jgi:hypothetical protein
MTAMSAIFVPFACGTVFTVVRHPIPHNHCIGKLRHYRGLCPCRHHTAILDPCWLHHACLHQRRFPVPASPPLPQNAVYDDTEDSDDDGAAEYNQDDDGGHCGKWGCDFGRATGARNDRPGFIYSHRPS